MSEPLYLLDTNSCIYLLAKARPVLTARVEQCAPGTVAISAIVCAELAMGLGEAGVEDPTALDRFIRTFPVLPFDETAGRAYARVPFRRGKLDRLIAAHALALQATLITSNGRDFADVSGLAIEDWTLPL